MFNRFYASVVLSHTFLILQGRWATDTEAKKDKDSSHVSITYDALMYIPWIIIER